MTTPPTDKPIVSGLPNSDSPAAHFVAVVDHRRAILAAILLLAAALRFIGLTAVPPGLNQDEAANAWNAWCILHTGGDQTATPWPILYTRAMGENRSTLFLYWMMPFQAVGGLNVWTTRLPAAIAGLLTVALLYWTAARLFNPTVGLVAAFLLALDPWAIQLARWGHEASIAPLLALLPVAAAACAGLPIAAAPGRPRIGFALGAGLIAGGCAYGYPAVRLFLIPFAVLCLVAILIPRRAASMTANSVATSVEASRGRRLAAIAAYALGFALTLAPLVWQHVVHSDAIARRAAAIWLWSPDDAPAAKFAKVAGRYAAHFAPRFLITEGDVYEIQSAKAPWWAATGQMYWSLVPMLVGGAICVVRRTPSSIPARIILVWLLCYPLGDIWNSHMRYADGEMSLHALRSAPGLCGLILIAAIGAVGLTDWLARRSAKLARGVFGVWLVLVFANAAAFLGYYFAAHPRRAEVRTGFHAALVEVLYRAGPQIAAADAIFCTIDGFAQPHYVTLVLTGHDPAAWFREPRDIRTAEGSDEWEYVFRFGKWRFLYDGTMLGELSELRRNGREDRVLLIVRPAEIAPGSPLEQRPPVLILRNERGYADLLVYELVL